jgi:hypothetical protein
LYRGGNFSLVPPIGAWNFLKHDFEKEFFNFCNFFSWVLSSVFFFGGGGDKKIGNFLDFLKPSVNTTEFAIFWKKHDKVIYIYSI